MRRFKLLRHRDVSGVSGTGEVAEGIQFTDGSVALRWHGDHPATAVWPGVDDVMAVHGHGGDTELVWVDVAHQWLHFKSYSEHRTSKVSWHNSRTCTSEWCGSTPDDATRPDAPGGGA